MQFMKRLVFGFLVFMISVVWPGLVSEDISFSWAGIASFAQECWKRFVRIWTIDGGYDTSTRSFVRLPGSRLS